MCEGNDLHSCTLKLLNDGLRSLVSAFGLSVQQEVIGHFPVAKQIASNRRAHLPDTHDRHLRPWSRRR